MTPSAVGALIVAILIGMDRSLGGSLLVATIASFAFGATAIVTLDALGGSSPLIYVVPSLALVASVAFRRESRRQIGTLFARDATVWLVLLLAVHSVASAILLPRLFAGATSAFVPSRQLGVIEMPLEPTMGNITQTAYMALGILTFLAFGVVTLERAALRSVRIGFFTWAFLTALFGALDLGGKLVGLGDILEPIRTASYAMLTSEDLVLAGYVRVAGAHSEASSFAGAALASLTFCVSYWLRTGSWAIAALAASLLVLLLLSTSTTAYVALGVLAAWMGAAMVKAGMAESFGRFTPQHLALVAFLVVGASILIAICLIDDRVFDPAIHLFETAVLNKGDSESARGRGYWNARSVDAFVETGGLGIGLGSSRASNWAIAVLSQLGLVGAALLLAIIVGLARRAPRPGFGGRAARSEVALHDAARNCALTMLLSGTIAGNGADPGSLFFVCLATVLACRAHISDATAAPWVSWAAATSGRSPSRPRPRAAAVPAPVVGP